MHEAPPSGPSSVLESADGTKLAVYDLALPEHDAATPPVLFAHATGFCGRMYEPLARALDHSAIGFDFRGHGDSARPEDTSYPWERFGEDALAVARAVASQHGPLLAFGHSMGGAALLMAALEAPELFSALYVFEPIVLPPGLRRADGESPMVAAARKRRDHFPSREEALENFRAKQPLSTLSPDVLRLYVEHGFHRSADGLRLQCQREDEARIFATSGIDAMWQKLNTLTVRTTVAYGQNVEGYGPHDWAPEIAKAIPGGKAQVFEDLGHLGPFQAPAVVAQAVGQEFGLSVRKIRSTEE